MLLEKLGPLTEANRVDMSLCKICTYVFTPHSIRPLDFSDKLCSVEADLDDIVEQSESWCQREGGHKQSHKAVLDYCNNKTCTQTFRLTWVHFLIAEVGDFVNKYIFNRPEATYSFPCTLD